MKIGIFGGCFNPPHKMHKKIARDLISEGCLDKVIFIPTGNNYNKKELIDIDYRIDMLNLIIDEDTMEVSTISKNMNFQYTFEVLDYFRAKYPKSEIYFVCGTDNMNDFNKWKNYEYILSTYKLLVVVRNGDNVDKLMQEYAKYVDNICITNIEENLVSSTLIRNAIRENNNEYIKTYVDAKVIEYINDRDLYKS